jgi:hypothetical protein
MKTLLFVSTVPRTSAVLVTFILSREWLSGANTGAFCQTPTKSAVVTRRPLWNYMIRIKKGITEDKSFQGFWTVHYIIRAKSVIPAKGQ